MGGVGGRRAWPEPPAAPSSAREQPEHAALTVFALLIVAAPLAFGAVDRLVQIVLLAVLAIGLALRPPAAARLGRWSNALVLAGLVILIGKEFAPASLFGATAWRTTLAQDFGVRFSWMHHPEPGRAVDALLAGVVAGIWFLWVRTLAANRANRAGLAWSLFGSAVAVAIVSFATHRLDPQAIYGLRWTPGWRGFGPFPNRNHTACFLAMGALVGAGCVVRAAMRRHWKACVLGAGALVPVLAALLRTESRGGLVAFAAGALIFLGCTLAKLRSRRSLAISAAACLALAVAALAFGAPVLARFSSDSGAGSNAMRVLIWKDTLTLWREAPLLGHGAGSFGSLFPMVQTLLADNAVVLHPESSWLQWLAELGALPVLLGAGALAIFAGRHVRAMFRKERSFFLVVAAFAAFGAWIMHSAIDVPGHRWGTAAFALAALALACAPRRDNRASSVHWPQALRRAALVPASIAVFWALPLFSDRPAWSPLSLSRLLAREAAGGASLPELEEELVQFPLNPALHRVVGMRRLVRDGPLAPEWTQHFHVATRLTPGSWAMPLALARACEKASPGQALHYWQMAIERGAFRREELFKNALTGTADLPGAAAAWATYAESNPELLLVLARAQPGGDEGRASFEQWWRERAVPGLAGKGEADSFYAVATRWATPEQIDLWMERYAAAESRDFIRWAAMLHAAGSDARAWSLLAKHLPEPAFPAVPPRPRLSELERQSRVAPGDPMKARAYAHALDRGGDATRAGEVILGVARQPGAPRWFIQKAAYLLAAAGELPDAVTMMLMEPPPR